MVTFVKCSNLKCSEYNKEKSVVSADILRMDATKCPACGSHMKVARQINVSHKGYGGKRIPPSRPSSAGGRTKRPKTGRKRGRKSSGR
jgi:hypothetical protein